ncbi:hypothetical protein Tco_0267826 [Tanacetum coccineum]
MFLKHLDSLSCHIINLTAEGDLRKFSDIGAWYAIEDCVQYDKKCSNPTNAISDETIAYPNAQIVGDDMVRVQEYTLPVTYPNEVEKTLGTPIEVEPLNETKVKEVGLNYNHNTPLSSREVPSFDEPDPQPQPFPRFSSLEVDLGEERDPEPTIKPHSSDSFRMKVVATLTIHTPPSPHVASFHPKDMYCYHRLCIDDPMKHYGFKRGLLGHSGSLGVDFLNFEMIEDDWRLESKEVSFLREGDNLPVWPRELKKVIFDEKKLGSS